MNARKTAVLLSLDLTIKNAQYRLDKFQANFAKNPLYAFQWGDDAVCAAATMAVAKEVQAWLQLADRDVTVEQVEAELTKSIMRAARFPTSSTSALTNQADQATNAARAQLLEELGYIQG